MYCGCCHYFSDQKCVVIFGLWCWYCTVTRNVLIENILNSVLVLFYLFFQIAYNFVFVTSNCSCIIFIPVLPAGLFPTTTCSSATGPESGGGCPAQRWSPLSLNWSRHTIIWRQNLTFCSLSAFLKMKYILDYESRATWKERGFCVNKKILFWKETFLEIGHIKFWKIHNIFLIKIFFIETGFSWLK
jgi:hypothetical protein